MILQKFSRIFYTEHRPASNGLKLPEEGMVMTYVNEGQDVVVNTCNGGAGEVFAGIALARNTPPLFLTHIVEGTVEGTEIELPRIAVAGQALVKVGGQVKTLVADAAAIDTAAKAAVDADVVHVHADMEGEAYEILFKYEPTVAEAAQMTGDVAIGGLSQHVVGDVGVITRGDVATTYFDAGVDWNGVIDEVYMGPGGIFTTDSTGELAKGVTVVSAPSAGCPYLVVRVSA